MSRAVTAPASDGAEKWLGVDLADPPVSLELIAKAQGFQAGEPALGVEAVNRELEKGLAAVSRGERYFINVLIDPEAQREGH